MVHRRIRWFGPAMAVVVAFATFAMVTRADEPPPPPTPTKAQVLDQLEQEFGEIGQMVGGLNGDEKAKFAAIKKALGEELDAHPEELGQLDALTPRLMTQMRYALTPEHRKKLDEMIAEHRRELQNLITANDLKLIGGEMMLYVQDHGNAYPPDLGALLVSTKGELKPTHLLVGGSTTTPPADFTKLDDKAKADWVNRNTDFEYLGKGRKNDLPDGFVLAYDKPEASKDLFVLHADGSVVEIAPEAVAKTLAELTAGTNPPPSARSTDLPPPAPGN